MTQPNVALVVTCTKTKRLASCERMAFGRLPPGTVESVVAQWTERAREAGQHGAAHQLYGGAGWAQTQKAWDVAGGALFVASAGFGLLRSEDEVPPYAATFSLEADRVASVLQGHGSAAQAHRAWWRGINTARGGEELPMCGVLAGFERVVVALSAHYFAAARDDLEALAKQRGPESLFVLATGVESSDVPEALRACLLPIGVNVERLLSGPRATLNQRALVWLLEEVVPCSGWVRASVEGEIARRLNGTTAVAHEANLRMSDEAVTAWVREQWRSEPKLGRTVLLRRLRDAGRACEQKRFSRLVEVMERSNEGQSRLSLEP